MDIQEPVREPFRERKVVGREASATWGTAFFFGAMLVVLGIFSWSAAGIASLASVLLFGGIILAGGIFEIFSAIRHRKTISFAPPFLGGLLSVAVGAILLARPLAGLSAITLLLGGYFLASGLFRGLISIIDRYPNWGWDLLYGIVAVVAGATVLRQWPISSLWVVGTLVGAVLFMRGVAMMGAALSLRKVLRTVHT